MSESSASVSSMSANEERERKRRANLKTQRDGNGDKRQRDGSDARHDRNGTKKSRYNDRSPSKKREESSRPEGSKHEESSSAIQRTGVNLMRDNTRKNLSISGNAHANRVQKDDDEDSDSRAGRKVHDIKSNRAMPRSSMARGGHRGASIPREREPPGGRSGSIPRKRGHRRGVSIPREREAPRGGHRGVSNPRERGPPGGRSGSVPRESGGRDRSGSAPRNTPLSRRKRANSNLVVPEEMKPKSRAILKARKEVKSNSRDIDSDSFIKSRMLERKSSVANGRGKGRGDKTNNRSDADSQGDESNRNANRKGDGDRKGDGKKGYGRRADDDDARESAANRSRSRGREEASEDFGKGKGKDRDSKGKGGKDGIIDDDDEHESGKGKGEDRESSKGKGDVRESGKGKGDDREYGKGKGDDRESGKGKGDDRESGKGKGDDRESGKGKGDDRESGKGKGDDRESGKGKGDDRESSKGEGRGKGDDDWRKSDRRDRDRNRGDRARGDRDRWGTRRDSRGRRERDRWGSRRDDWGRDRWGGDWDRDDRWGRRDRDREWGRDREGRDRDREWGRDREGRDRDREWGRDKEGRDREREGREVRDSKSTPGRPQRASLRDQFSDGTTTGKIQRPGQVYQPRVERPRHNGPTPASLGVVPEMLEPNENGVMVPDPSKASGCSPTDEKKMEYPSSKESAHSIPRNLAKNMKNPNLINNPNAPVPTGKGAGKGSSRFGGPAFNPDFNPNSGVTINTGGSSKGASAAVGPSSVEPGGSTQVDANGEIVGEIYEPKPKKETAVVSGTTANGELQVNTEGSIVLADGSVIPAAGITLPDGTVVPPPQTSAALATSTSVASTSESGGNVFKFGNKSNSTLRYGAHGQAVPPILQNEDETSTILRDLHRPVYDAARFPDGPPALLAGGKDTFMGRLDSKGAPKGKQTRVGGKNKPQNEVKDGKGGKGFVSKDKNTTSYEPYVDPNSIQIPGQGGKGKVGKDVMEPGLLVDDANMVSAIEDAIIETNEIAAVNSMAEPVKVTDDDISAYLATGIDDFDDGFAQTTASGCIAEDKFKREPGKKLRPFPGKGGAPDGFPPGMPAPPGAHGMPPGMHLPPLPGGPGAPPGAFQPGFGPPGPQNLPGGPALVVHPGAPPAVYFPPGAPPPPGQLGEASSNGAHHGQQLGATTSSGPTPPGGPPPIVTPLGLSEGKHPQWVPLNPALPPHPQFNPLIPNPILNNGMVPTNPYMPAHPTFNPMIPDPRVVPQLPPPPAVVDPPEQAGNNILTNDDSPKPGGKGAEGGSFVPAAHNPLIPLGVAKISGVTVGAFVPGSSPGKNGAKTSSSDEFDKLSVDEDERDLMGFAMNLDDPLIAEQRAHEEDRKRIIEQEASKESGASAVKISNFRLKGGKMASSEKERIKEARRAAAAEAEERQKRLGSSKSSRSMKLSRKHEDEDDEETNPFALKMDNPFATTEGMELGEGSEDNDESIAADDPIDNPMDSNGDVEMEIASDGELALDVEGNAILDEKGNAVLVRPKKNSASAFKLRITNSRKGASNEPSRSGKTVTSSSAVDDDPFNIPDENVPGGGLQNDEELGPNPFNEEVPVIRDPFDVGGDDDDEEGATKECATKNLTAAADYVQTRMGAMKPERVTKDPFDVEDGEEPVVNPFRSPEAVTSGASSDEAKNGDIKAGKPIVDGWTPPVPKDDLDPARWAMKFLKDSKVKDQILDLNLVQNHGSPDASESAGHSGGEQQSRSRRESLRDRRGFTAGGLSDERRPVDDPADIPVIQNHSAIQQDHNGPEKNNSGQDRIGITPPTSRIPPADVVVLPNYLLPEISGETICGFGKHKDCKYVEIYEKEACYVAYIQSVRDKYFLSGGVIKKKELLRLARYGDQRNYMLGKTPLDEEKQTYFKELSAYKSEAETDFGWFIERMAAELQVQANRRNQKYKEEQQKIKDEEENTLKEFAEQNDPKPKAKGRKKKGDKIVSEAKAQSTSSVDIISENTVDKDIAYTQIHTPRGGFMAYLRGKKQEIEQLERLVLEQGNDSVEVKEKIEELFYNPFCVLQHLKDGKCRVSTAAEIAASKKAALLKIGGKKEAKAKYFPQEVYSITPFHDVEYFSLNQLEISHTGTEFLRSFCRCEKRHFGKFRFLVGVMDFDRPERILDLLLLLKYTKVWNKWCDDAYVDCEKTPLVYMEKLKNAVEYSFIPYVFNPLLSPDYKILIEQRLKVLYRTECCDVIGVFGREIFPKMATKNPTVKEEKSKNPTVEEEKSKNRTVEEEKSKKNDETNSFSPSFPATLTKDQLIRSAVIEYMQNRSCYDKIQKNTTEETTIMRDVLTWIIDHTLDLEGDSDVEELNEIAGDFSPNNDDNDEEEGDLLTDTDHQIADLDAKGKYAKRRKIGPKAATPGSKAKGKAKAKTANSKRGKSGDRERNSIHPTPLTKYKFPKLLRRARGDGHCIYMANSKKLIMGPRGIEEYDLPQYEPELLDSTLAASRGGDSDDPETDHTPAVGTPGSVKSMKAKSKGKKTPKAKAKTGDNRRMMMDPSEKQFKKSFTTLPLPPESAGERFFVLTEEPNTVAADVYSLESAQKGYQSMKQLLEEENRVRRNLANQNVDQSASASGNGNNTSVMNPAVPNPAVNASIRDTAYTYVSAKVRDLSQFTPPTAESLIKRILEVARKVPYDRLSQPFFGKLSDGTVGMLFSPMQKSDSKDSHAKDPNVSFSSSSSSASSANENSEDNEINDHPKSSPKNKEIQLSLDAQKLFDDEVKDCCVPPRAGDFARFGIHDKLRHNKDGVWIDNGRPKDQEPIIDATIKWEMLEYYWTLKDYLGFETGWEEKKAAAVVGDSTPNNSIPGIGHNINLVQFLLCDQLKLDKELIMGIEQVARKEVLINWSKAKDISNAGIEMLREEGLGALVDQE